MDADILKTELLVMAVIKHAQTNDMSAVVEKRGDKERGAIVVRINRYDMDDGESDGAGGQNKLGRSRIETRQFNPTHNRYVWQALRSPTGEVWMGAEEADALIARQMQYDPDCWVVAFDDARGQKVQNPDQNDTVANPFTDFTGLA